MTEEIEKFKISIADLTPSTQRTYLTIINTFKNEYKGDFEDQEKVMFFLDGKKSELAQKTFNLYLSAIKRFYFYLFRGRDEHVNKIRYYKRIRKASNKHEKKFLNLQELRTLREYTRKKYNKRDALIIELMSSLGLRSIETIRLTKKDVVADSLGYHLRIQRKGCAESQKRSVKITHEVYNRILEVAGDHNTIFHSYRGKPLNTSITGAMIKQAYLDALDRKEDGLTAHSLRHSVAVLLTTDQQIVHTVTGEEIVITGKSMQEISLLLGHSSQEITQLYTHAKQDIQRLKNRSAEDDIQDLLSQ